MINAQVIQDSITSSGARLTTMVWDYPRFIHGEVMTHRVFSRNAMSSRAVPVAKMLEQVRKRPVVPIHWGANQPGMQAREEISPERRKEADHEWRRAADHAAYFAQSLHALGLHKQIANRLLEPFQWMKTIITATEWDNFFDLRDHPDAEPHFQRLAQAARAAMRDSTPVQRSDNVSQEDAWHLPFITDAERAAVRVAGDSTGPVFLARMSAARCARVSFLNHDGTSPDVVKDLELFQKLAGARPMHASPLEHPAWGAPPDGANLKFANFKGWISLRFMMESQQASPDNVQETEHAG